MAYEIRDNGGTLFKNERKQTENQPDYRGEAKIGGVLYDMGAWVKEAKNGHKFFGMKFTPQSERKSKAQKPAEDAKPAAESAPAPEHHDDLPF